MSERKVGRPSAGVRKGEKASEYSQTSFRAPPEFQAKLEAVGRIQVKSTWRVMMAALDAYVENFEPEAREATLALTERILHEKKTAKR
jgi:hypothetical protein